MSRYLFIDIQVVTTASQVICRKYDSFTTLFIGAQPVHMLYTFVALLDRRVDETLFTFKCVNQTKFFTYYYNIALQDDTPKVSRRFQQNYLKLILTFAKV
jgi:hypothetical protein